MVDLVTVLSRKIYYYLLPLLAVHHGKVLPHKPQVDEKVWPHRHQVVVRVWPHSTIENPTNITLHQPQLL